MSRDVERRLRGHALACRHARRECQTRRGAGKVESYSWGKRRATQYNQKHAKKSLSLLPCIDTLALKQRPDLSSPGQLERLKNRPRFLVLTQESNQPPFAVSVFSSSSSSGGDSGSSTVGVRGGGTQCGRGCGCECGARSRVAGRILQEVLVVAARQPAHLHEKVILVGAELHSLGRHRCPSEYGIAGALATPALAVLSLRCRQHSAERLLGVLQPAQMRKGGGAGGVCVEGGGGVIVCGGKFTARTGV